MLTELIKTIILGHLQKIELYTPAHGRGPKKLSKDEIKQAFSDDPVYSIFGLDSSEYITAALAGGTITSVHRKIGDSYDESVRAIYIKQYNLAPETARYRTPIYSGDTEKDRTLDVYFELAAIPPRFRHQWKKFTEKRLREIAPNPRVQINAIAIEVRHCYQSADSKRAQADDAMARQCFISGILPLMLIFCKQSNQSIIRRYRSLWIVCEGHESYDVIKRSTGFDFYQFLVDHKEMFRRPVIEMLKRLQSIP